MDRFWREVRVCREPQVVSLHVDDSRLMYLLAFLRFAALPHSADAVTNAMPATFASGLPQTEAWHGDI